MSESSSSCINTLNPSTLYKFQYRVDSKALKKYTDERALHFFCAGNAPDFTYYTTSPKQSSVEYSNNSPTKNACDDCGTINSIQRKKGKRKNVRRNNRHTLISQRYEPVENRAQGIIKIGRIMTEQTIPELIDEQITDVYDYMDKSIALSQSKLLMNGCIRIINFDFHCKETKQVLFCVCCNIVSESKRVRGFQWKMVNKLFTAEDIFTEYGISNIYLPHGRYFGTFNTELSYGKCIGDMLSDRKQRLKILDNTRWCRTDVLYRVNNKKRLTLSVTKPEFIKTCCEYMGNINDIKLIPIVMFEGTNDKYLIQYICIVRITEWIDIGISFRFDAKNNEVIVCGIHLDKEYIQRQHELVSQHDHNCDCLDDFQSNIDDLRIGNPDDDKNRVKHYKQQVEQLKQLLLECGNATSSINSAYSDNPMHGVAYTANNL